MSATSVSAWEINRHLPEGWSRSPGHDISRDENLKAFAYRPRGIAVPRIRWRQLVQRHVTRSGSPRTGRSRGTDGLDNSPIYGTGRVRRFPCRWLTSDLSLPLHRRPSVDADERSRLMGGSDRSGRWLHYPARGRAPATRGRRQLERETLSRRFRMAWSKAGEHGIRGRRHSDAGHSRPGRAWCDRLSASACNVCWAMCGELSPSIMDLAATCRRSTTRTMTCWCVRSGSRLRSVSFAARSGRCLFGRARGSENSAGLN